MHCRNLGNFGESPITNPAARKTQAYPVSTGGRAAVKPDVEVGVVVPDRLASGRSDPRGLCTSNDVGGNWCSASSFKASIEAIVSRRNKLAKARELES